MSIWYRKKKIIIVISIILVLIVLLTIYIINNVDFSEEEKEEEIVTEKIEKKEKKETNLLKVDIKGEINNPGIYSLVEGSRVIDVIESASGLTNNADTSVINLSKKIEDEMVIIIYSKKEVKDFSKTKEIEKQVQEKCIQKDSNALKNDACIETKETTEINGKVNINTATKEELMTLKGIGESKALDIIKYREKKKFTNIEELKEVSGIGEALFAKIKENITV